MDLLDAEELLEDQRLIVFFLYEDEGENVRVEEVEEIAEIDFSEIIRHLDQGGSIFITHRRKPRLNVSSERKVQRSASRIPMALVPRLNPGKRRSERRGS